MKNRTKGLVGLTLGAALMVGGSTFALWQDRDTVTNERIQIGTMGVTAEVDWDMDMIEFWSPSDSITGTINVEARLLGDNLRATLEIADTADLGEIRSSLTGEAWATVGDRFDGQEPDRENLTYLLNELFEVSIGEYDAGVLDQGTHIVEVPIRLTFTNQGDLDWAELGVYGQGQVFPLGSLEVILTQSVD